MYESRGAAACLLACLGRRFWGGREGKGGRAYVRMWIYQSYYSTRGKYTGSIFLLHEQYETDFSGIIFFAFRA